MHFQHHAHSRHLSSQRWSNLRDTTLRFANLRKARVQCLHNVLRDALNGVLCALHLLAHHLIYGQIVHRLRNIVLLGNRSQFGCDAKRHLKVATRLLFQLVTTVKGMEIHALQLNCI